MLQMSMKGSICKRIVVVVALDNNTECLCWSLLQAKPTQATRVPASASTPASMQRSRSDVDVNAAANATSRTRMPPVSSAMPSSASPFSSASALPPGSYASLGNTHSLMCVITSTKDVMSVGLFVCIYLFCW